MTTRFLDGKIEGVIVHFTEMSRTRLGTHLVEKIKSPALYMLNLKWKSKWKGQIDIGIYASEAWIGRRLKWSGPGTG